MFSLNPTDLEPVKLTTRRGWEIPLNPEGLYRVTEAMAVGRRAKFDRDYPDRAFVRKRKDFCSVYNCHGLTFLNRRAWMDAKHIERILSDDEYAPVNEWDVLPGDIAIYWAESKMHGQAGIDHTGVVVHNQEMFRDAASLKIGKPVIWVVSKWAEGPEYIHQTHQCPWDYCDVKYWREGKNDKPAVV